MPEIKVEIKELKTKRSLEDLQDKSFPTKDEFEAIDNSFFDSKVRKKAIELMEEKHKEVSDNVRRLGDWIDKGIPKEPQPIPEDRKKFEDQKKLDEQYKKGISSLQELEKYGEETIRDTWDLWKPPPKPDAKNKRPEMVRIVNALKEAKELVDKEKGASTETKIKRGLPHRNTNSTSSATLVDGSETPETPTTDSFNPKDFVTNVEAEKVNEELKGVTNLRELVEKYPHALELAEGICKLWEEYQQEDYKDKKGAVTSDENKRIYGFLSSLKKAMAIDNEVLKEGMNAAQNYMEGKGIEQLTEELNELKKANNETNEKLKKTNDELGKTNNILVKMQLTLDQMQQTLHKSQQTHDMMARQLLKTELANQERDRTSSNWWCRSVSVAVIATFVGVAALGVTGVQYNKQYNS